MTAMLRHLQVFLGLTLVIGGTACSSGTAPAGVSTPTFATSDCGVCVMDACRDAVSRCQGDAECQKWEACLEACPVNAVGNADKACEAACPGGTDSASLLLQRRVTACRTEGAGSACTACGPVTTTPTAPNPMLQQACAGGTGATACARCESQSCCKTAADCAGDPACVQLGDCTSACGGTANPLACESECAAKAPEASRTRHAQRWACLELKCAGTDACGRSAPSACATCASSKCANEFVDCYGSTECRTVAACANRCANNGPCVDACLQSASPAVRNRYIDINICGQNRCPSECGAR